MQGVSLIRFIIGLVASSMVCIAQHNTVVFLKFSTSNIISGALFISPAPTWKKSREEFHPYPYLSALMNCILWVFYGLPIVHPDSTLVITINSFGLLMVIIYLTMFFIYTSKKNYRRTIIMFILGEVVLLATIVAISLLAFHMHTKRSMMVGIVCDIFGIIMDASPLSNLRQVIRTRSTEYMPFMFCLVGFANGVIWFAYAFLKTFDPYIAFGNGLGAVCGLVQLTVFAFYTIMAMKNNKNSGVCEAGRCAAPN